MPSYNKVILMGNLTRDPETRTTPNGTTICKIGLAVNRTFTGQDGQKKDDTTFVDCDAFGKTADAIAKWMTKGRAILIEGRLRTDQWQDKETGKQRSKLGVIIESSQFVGGREAEATQQNATPSRKGYPPMTPHPSGNIDDEPPF